MFRTDRLTAKKNWKEPIFLNLPVLSRGSAYIVLFLTHDKSDPALGFHPCT